MTTNPFFATASIQTAAAVEAIEATRIFFDFQKIPKH
jgi:hypothetical protein